MRFVSVLPHIFRWSSLLLFVLLAHALPKPVRAGTAAVTLTFPNTSYPALGELVEMLITYNDTADPNRQDTTYPLGHVITDMSGTRTVWQATASDPTTYTLNSTATILGVVPLVDPMYVTYDATLNTVVPYEGSLPADGIAYYGNLVTYAFYNGTNFTSPDGGPLFPTYFIVYNNFYYPTGVPDLMDYDGWMLWLDSYQPGNYNISHNPGPYAQYQYAVNYFASGYSVSGYNDITDVTGYPPNYGSFFPNGPGGGFDGTIVAAAASAPGTVLGDPQFTGLRGQSYQVHGIDGGVYSLISDRLVQVNGRFTFIGLEDEHECLTDAASQPLYVCWSHAGSYISALSLQTSSLSSLLVEAGSGRHGFAAVLLDNSPLQVGDKAALRVDNGGHENNMTVTWLDVRTVLIEHAGVYTMRLQNSAGFLNLVELSVDSWSRLTTDVQSHGLLGQTWRLYNKGEDVKAIEGRIDDYLLARNDMSGCDDVYSKFEC